MPTTKRAMLSAFPVDFFAYISFVLVILIFWVLFTFGATKQDITIKSQATDLDSGLVLLNILRTPVGSSSVAEILAQGAESGDFKEFQAQSIPILDQHFASNMGSCCWVLEVSREGESIYRKEANACADVNLQGTGTTILVPSADAERPPIEVQLTLYQGRVGTDSPMPKGDMGRASQCTYT